MALTLTGRLDECLLLAYRSPARSVAGLVPRPLELVTRDGWAFWNIVACRVEGMRPAGLPRWAGIAYHHVAYRLYVRARTESGETLEGLHFVRSDADRVLPAWLGNRLTDFRFHRSAIRLESGDRSHVGAPLRVTVRTTDGLADVHLIAAEAGNVSWSPDSCFASPDEAGRFLKYRPLGISADASGRRLKLAEVERDEAAWREIPIEARETRWGFFDRLGVEARLERATRVAPIDYVWRLGRRANAG